MRRASKRNIVSSRLKAFNSFTDSFSSSTLRSGWRQVSGNWSSGSNQLSSSSNGILTIPMSRSNVTVTATIPSGSTGTGVVFWQQDINNYWAAYGYSSNYSISSCNNGSCSGTEQFTNSRSCSCYPTYGTCQSSLSDVYGTCQSSSTPAYGTCSSSTSPVYGTCSSSTSPVYGTCSSTSVYGTCSSSTTFGTCSFTPGSTSFSYFTVNRFSADCSDTPNTVQVCSGSCNGQTGGCTPQTGRGCCRTTTTTSGSWNYSGCSFEGQQVATGTSWNYGGCSFPGQQIYLGESWNYSGCVSNGQQIFLGNQTTWNYGGCSSNGQQVFLGNQTTWNYGGCSSEGQQVFLGNQITWNYGGCSSNGQQVFLGQQTNWNYSGCSSNGQVVTTGQASTCNNGQCSGTETFTDTRSCSCTTGTERYIRVIKVLNGIRTVLGNISVPVTPLTITAATSGNTVTISGSTGSQVFTNNDSTTYRNFGTIKDDGGVESGSVISQFTALVS